MRTLAEKEKILAFAQELCSLGQISKQQLKDTYFHNFIRVDERGLKL